MYLDDEESMTIVFPSNENNYTNNGFGIWEIRAPDELTLSIELATFDVQDNDFIFIGDGLDMFSTDKTSQCSWQRLDVLTPMFTSKSSTIRLIFTSDHADTGLGFEIHFEVINFKGSRPQEVGE